MQKEGPAALASCCLPIMQARIHCLLLLFVAHTVAIPLDLSRQPAVPVPVPTDRRRLSPDASPKKARWRCPSQFPPGPGPLLWSGPTPHHGRCSNQKKKDGSPDRAESFRFFFSFVKPHTRKNGERCLQEQRYPSIPSAAAVPLVQKATGFHASNPIIAARGGRFLRVGGSRAGATAPSTRVAPASLSHAQPIRTGAGHDCHHIALAPIRCATTKDVSIDPFFNGECDVITG